MDIGSVKPVLTGLTAPVPKAATEQKLATTTELRADKAVNITEKTDGNGVGSSTDASSSSDGPKSGALTSANTIKAKPRDQATGFELLADEGPAKAPPAGATPESGTSAADSARLDGGSQESAIRMKAMIDAWQGNGGTSRTAVLDASA